jgi:hypothetical protein
MQRPIVTPIVHEGPSPHAPVKPPVRVKRRITLYYI